MILCIILSQQRRQTKQYINAKAKRQKGDTEMNQLAQRYIGKYVLLDTVASGSYDGLAKEVVDNAVVLEKNGEEIIVNLDYVLRLREYPKNKRGKRKSVITD